MLSYRAVIQSVWGGESVSSKQTSSVLIREAEEEALRCLIHAEEMDYG